MNVVTARDIEEFRTAIGQLTAVSFRQTKTLLSQIEDSNPILFRDRLLEAFPALVAPYLTAAGELSAAWYEGLRAEAVGGSFVASTAVSLAPERSDALVRYSLAPLFGESTSTVLGLLAGGLQRIVANGARDTLIDNVMNDRVRVGYARIPRAGCCAFCGMLASRGAVYNSRAAAGGVVGRGVDASVTAGKVGGQGAGQKSRGSRAIGSSKYHDHCKCIPAPVFQSDTFHVDVRDKYKAMYDDSFELNDKGSISAKETLASWRQVHGTR